MIQAQVYVYPEVEIEFLQSGKSGDLANQPILFQPDIGRIDNETYVL